MPAKQDHIQGVVHFHVVIGTNGTISDLKLISDYPLLVPAAIEAVKKWLYKPMMKGGQAVAVETDWPDRRSALLRVSLVALIVKVS